MSGNALLPGYANFMEEDIMPENQEDQPSTENMDQMEENADMAADGNEAAMRLKNTSLNIDNVFNSFDQLQMMHDYIQKNGVNRTFLYFFGSRFEEAGVEIPAEENQDVIGDPNSQLSMACMASIGDTLHKIWEFIKRICRRIMDFLTALVDAVFGRFRNVSSIIGKLRDKIQDINLSATPESLKGYEMTNIWGWARVSRNVIELAKRVEDVVNQVHKIYGDIAGYRPITQYEKLKSRIDEVESYAKQMGSVFVSFGTIPISRVTRQMMIQALDWCGDLVQDSNIIKRSVEVVKADAKASLKIAEDYEKRASKLNQPEAKESADNVRKFIVMLNKASTICGSVARNEEKLARLICLTLSRILARYSNGGTRIETSRTAF